jgi:hypothetical protein
MRMNANRLAALICSSARSKLDGSLGSYPESMSGAAAKGFLPINPSYSTGRSLPGLKNIPTPSTPRIPQKWK